MKDCSLDYCMSTIHTSVCQMDPAGPLDQHLFLPIMTKRCSLKENVSVRVWRMCQDGTCSCHFLLDLRQTTHPAVSAAAGVSRAVPAQWAHGEVGRRSGASVPPHAEEAVSGELCVDSI